MVRLVVWNCRHRLAPAKEALLRSLDPDAAVLCEVTADDAERLSAYRVGGDAAPRGVAVWTRDGIEPVDLAQSFVAAAYVPALGATLASTIRRVGTLDGPVVLAGDFNATLTMPGADAANRLALADLGLISAYHAFHGAEHGAEPDATYRHGADGKLWHIDFCFLPRAWAARLVDVAIRADVIESGLSDHAPLVVDLADDAEAPTDRATEP